MPGKTPNLGLQLIGDNVELQPDDYNAMLLLIDEFLASAYGELVIADNATETVISFINTWYPITAGWATDQFEGVTLDADGTMTVQVAGAYQTLCSIAFTSAASSATLEFGVFKNGVLIPDHVALTWTNTATFPNTVTITGVDPLEVGDVLDLRVRAPATSGIAVTVTDSNFNIVRI